MSEYADALPLLLAALADLRKGQLVQDERYVMMDLMAAIEINDPRTDTYLHAKKQQEAHQPPLPPFDASRPLSAEEIVWVVDEIVRLEATFLSGHPLSSTLWTCNYLRPSSLSALSFPSSLTTSPSPLMSIVFRALLLATLKSCEIVYEEMSKGRVYEHEDVHLPLSSLSFNTLMASCFPPLPPSSPPETLSRLALPGQDLHDFDQPPPERTVSVDDVLRALDEALRWLTEEREEGGVEMGEEVREALIARVTMRIDLLYTLALLTAPAYTSPAQITHHLTRLSSYSSLFLSASSTSASPPSPAPDPKPELLSIFHPSPSSVPLLGTQQPPRPTALLSVGEGYDLLLRETVGDLGELMRLWESWFGKTREGGGGEGGGWREVREFALRAGRRGGSPYIRSVRQSVISPPSPPNLFSSSPPRLLSLSFLHTLTSLSLGPSFSSSHAALPLLSWLDRLALQFLLPTTSGLAGQNRGRQRRIVVKSVGAFVELVREAEEEIVPLLLQLLSPAGEAAEEAAIQRIPLAMAAHALEVVLEALLSGFEEQVGLFRDEEEARREGWYVAERVARILRGMWEGLLLRGAEGKEKEGWEEGRRYVARKKAEARVVEGTCRGSWMTSLLHPTSPPTKFSSPFLPSLSFPPSPADAARGRFNQRFNWLGKLSSPPTGAFAGCEGVARWREYEADVAKTAGEEKTSLVAEAKAAFSRALDELDKLEQGGLGSSQQEDEWLSKLRETAKANLAFLDSTSASGGGGGKAQLSWRSEWFAQWSRLEQ